MVLFGSKKKILRNESNYKIKKGVDENHLLFNFYGCFYCVFFVGHFDSVFFTFFELFDNFLFKGNLGYSFFVGFGLVGF